MANDKAFTEAYTKLNPAQKKAVDTVEGPVLVIAGPGTGKTHVLTLRIANILRATQANASNILVLTFTESAARTVRRRLGELVGESTARESFISTFHGFAEHLLSTYNDSFPEARGKRLAGDVEATLLWREVLENEELVALRTTKSPFFYLRDLARLRDDLVRERISLGDYRTWLTKQAEIIRSDESLYYTRDSKYGKKGDFKPEGQKKLERLEKGEEAIRLIEAYEALKEKRDLYDFADVLRFAVDGLQEDADLRATIQEQYQYILADEHQDANALQHALLDTLAYDDHPNIFVVGDEKQAIYRFQGADSSHFKTFTEHFPRTEVIALTDSYRSFQGILDASHKRIENLPAAQGVHQKLSATREGEATLLLLQAPDSLAERDQVATLIQQAIQEGTAPEEIAVIASRNATANLFAEHLLAKGVPTLRAGDVELSSRPLLRSVLALMRLVANPLDLEALRETLLAPWWDIPLAERSLLLVRSRDRELWDALRADYPDIAECLAQLQKEALSKAPLELLSKMLATTGARSYFLSHAEHLDDVALLRRIVMHIEDILARDPNRTFREVIEAFTKASEHGLESIKSSTTLEKGKVTVITAHKAKGMEFEQVFLVGLTANNWEKGGVAAKIPSPVDQTRTLEDITKLFYVAMTRAKDRIVFSYARENGDGREMVPSSLVPEGLQSIAAESDPLPLLHIEVEPSALVNDLVRRFLTEDGLSPSALNEYLESPPCFFARRVLRLHEPEAPATVIGTSVHEGIAEYLRTKDKEKAKRTLEDCLSRSLLPRNSAYERVAEHARQSLDTYLSEGPTPETSGIEKPFTLKRVIGDTEVILQGKIDAIFVMPEGERIVDFKTSSDIHIKDEKHARQLAFYDLLLSNNGHTPNGACIIQVGPDTVEEYPVPITDETRAELASTLDAVLSELLSGKWRKGEPNEYDDLLKMFE